MAKPEFEEIVDAIEASGDGVEWYLDRETGRVEILSEEDFDLAEDDDPAAPEWQKEPIELARTVLEDEEERFLPLPNMRDVDEWGLMERFAMDMEDEFGDSARGMSQAMRGGGPSGGSRTRPTNLACSSGGTRSWGRRYVASRRAGAGTRGSTRSDCRKKTRKRAFTRARKRGKGE